MKNTTSTSKEELGEWLQFIDGWMRILDNKSLKWEIMRVENGRKWALKLRENESLKVGENESSKVEKKN